MNYAQKHQALFEGIVRNLKFLDEDGNLLTAGKSGKIPPGQIIGSSPGGGDTEKFQYFYHPDHLGSTSYITDASGEVYQHLEYFAFGETFVEEHSNTHRTPYLFNGKELDEETGLYYYGARYYDAQTSIWLSVDPLAEDMPNWSSYSYDFNNPLRFVDPTGMVPNDATTNPGLHYLTRNGSLSSTSKGLIFNRASNIVVSDISRSNYNLPFPSISGPLTDAMAAGVPNSILRVNNVSSNFTSSSSELIKYSDDKFEVGITTEFTNSIAELDKKGNITGITERTMTIKSRYELNKNEDGDFVVGKLITSKTSVTSKNISMDDVKNNKFRTDIKNARKFNHKAHYKTDLTTSDINPDPSQDMHQRGLEYTQRSEETLNKIKE